MARVKLPIVINGFDVVIKCLKDFDNKFEVTGKSEDFTEGFNCCKEIMLSAMSDYKKKYDLECSRRKY